MLLSLQKRFRIQYWDGFLRNQLLSLLTGRMNTRSRGSWIQIGWENISNTRSHMMDMGRNTMNGCLGMIYLRTLGLSLLRTMNHSSMPNILRRNITQTRSESELKVKDLSRKDKKTYSET